MNFNEIFKNDVAYDRVTKNQEFTIPLADTFLKKHSRWGQIVPHPF